VTRSGIAPNDTVLVAGAGGFIGGWLVRRFRERGLANIRAVDVKPVADWFQRFPDAENRVLDLRDRESCEAAAEGAHWVFNLACDMGGMGFIENNKAACMQSVLINTHLIEAARGAGCKRYFFASSACVYNQDKQSEAAVAPLAETDAYPAMPEDGYGWEKLFSERLCRHYSEDFGLETRVVRYHNVYGPEGTFDGGREKAPAAICRKVATAVVTGDHRIEIWGDGEQTRSFMFIDDCLDGTEMIMQGQYAEPINLGSSRIVTINRLVDIVESIAGVTLERRYKLDAPKGVRGRNSDNRLILDRFGWEPSIPLETGLDTTYRWIYDQVASALGRGRTAAHA